MALYYQILGSILPGGRVPLGCSLRVYKRLYTCIFTYTCTYTCIPTCVTALSSIRQHITIWDGLFTILFTFIYRSTDGGDRTESNYDCQNFQQVFTGVPLHVKHVFPGVPKIPNKFSRRRINRVHVARKVSQENWEILRFKIFKSNLLREWIPLIYTCILTHSCIYTCILTYTALYILTYATEYILTYYQKS